MKDGYWKQRFPPYTAHVRYNSGSHRFEIELESAENVIVATGMVRASYEPSFGIDVSDSALIQDEITRMLHRVQGRAEP